MRVLSYLFTVLLLQGCAGIDLGESGETGASGGDEGTRASEAPPNIDESGNYPTSPYPNYGGFRSGMRSED